MRQPHQDAVAWAREETWAFTVWKLKIYSLLLSFDLLLIVLISKGMPGHSLWRWLAIPVTAVFVYAFGAFLFYGAAALTELASRRRK